MDTVEDIEMFTYYLYITHLEDRFLKHCNICSNFTSLLPNPLFENVQRSNTESYYTEFVRNRSNVLLDFTL